MNLQLIPTPFLLLALLLFLLPDLRLIRMPLLLALLLLLHMLLIPIPTSPQVIQSKRVLPINRSFPSGRSRHLQFVLNLIPNHHPLSNLNRVIPISQNFPSGRSRLLQLVLNRIPNHPLSILNRIPNLFQNNPLSRLKWELGRQGSSPAMKIPLTVLLPIP
jgi:hypothetical protein